MSVCELKIFQLQCYSTKWFAVNEQSKLKILFNLPCEKWFQVCKISGFISSIFVFYKVIRICGSVVKFRGCFVVDMGLNPTACPPNPPCACQHRNFSCLQGWTKDQQQYIAVDRQVFNSILHCAGEQPDMQSWLEPVWLQPNLELAGTSLVCINVLSTCKLDTVGFMSCSTEFFYWWTLWIGTVVLFSIKWILRMQD